MTLQEIKDAVIAGKTVHWSNSNYKVIHEKDDWLIGYRPGEKGENYIGLTWRDGQTLNGKEEDFYIQGYHPNKEFIDGFHLDYGIYKSAEEVQKKVVEAFESCSINHEEVELRVEDQMYEPTIFAFYGVRKH